MNSSSSLKEEKNGARAGEEEEFSNIWLKLLPSCGHNKKEARIPRIFKVS